MTLFLPFHLFSFFYSFLDLIDFNLELADRLLNKPDETLKVMEESLTLAQEHLLKEEKDARFEYKFKSNIHIRLTNLPYFIEKQRLMTDSTDMPKGNLFTFNGSIVKASTPKVIRAYRIFECLKCRTKYKQYADLDQYGQCPKPDICTFNKNDTPCLFTKFEPIEDFDDNDKLASSSFSSSTTLPLNSSTNFSFSMEATELPFNPDSHSRSRSSISTSNWLSPDSRIDYQELRLQENSRTIPPGSIPKSLVLIATCDLVDICKLGDEILFCGTIITRWKTVRVGGKVDLEYCFYANNITILNQQAPLSFDSQAVIEDALCFWEEHQNSPIHGRNIIIQSFVRGLYGMFLTRMAVLLTVIGGSSVTGAAFSTDEVAHGRTHRKEGHLLLVGDPGTFKSQFLAAAADLCLRSVITSGSGSTSAGLTCSAVKEQGVGWQLEAGAFVLADRGICCVDEFNLIKSSDRTSIHEAMEQQTISMAKAGLICKLNTRCSVMAACNSKGKFENDVGITTTTAIASPLLSRFDLILILSDRHDSEWDERLADQLFNNLSGGKERSRQSISEPSSLIDENKEKILEREREKEREKCYWSHQKLQNYIHYIRQNLHPKMSKGSQIILSKYYQKQRSADLRDSARTTVRLLESLIRLSQAHAKLMFHSDFVTIDDAISAIILMETSLQTQTLLEKRPNVFAEADEDADSKFKLMKDQILRKLNISVAILEDISENI